MATASNLAAVSIETYYGNSNCSAGGLTTATLYEGYCTGIESFPLKSISAVHSGGTCSDATKSPVLYTYTGLWCESGFYASYDVTDEETCFSLDATLLGLSIKCE
ncbi:uncharacterized protein BO97DRAFT_405846 [Aspergillus homomorphus CBS 101889]|uniref:Uncharacterized protein n=1 Tax=Aspergillus homomorphus (strain CBS 101889) TaxID=1450537 RepID=A0A395HV01_ASPHC|nr:hypothetical protein BO97DRAFT_405846 [Aspergillus homomorphus CBS 101889]RAL11762.1 hypothetical protein BO97DRAFT_405846 [Aspergillus homomorphus CBS 101889]